MKRNFRNLRRGSFDLLVIGGGIYGAWTACDGAMRGLKVAIVEKGDWASGTSSSSSKLIHGGLRYLEQMRFGLVRKSLLERTRLLDIAPHRVLPIRFVVPFYRGGRVGPRRMKAGLLFYDLLAGGSSPLEGTSSFGKDETLERYSFLRDEGLLGAATYGDCTTDDARFTLEVVEAAVRAGAAAVNYAEARHLLSTGGRVCGAVVRDRVDGKEIEIEAGAVVDTAGPWAGTIGGGEELAGKIRLTKGVHIILPRLPCAEAFLLLTRRDRRVLFFIPWYGKTLVGTTDTDYRGDPDGVRPGNDDIAYLLDEIDHVLRPGIWGPGDIGGASAGLRTLRGNSSLAPASLSREWSLSMTRPGLLISIGGKFTSARADACRIVDRVLQMLGKPGRGKSMSGKRPLPFSPPEDFTAWKRHTLQEGLKCGLDSETASWTARRYGTAVSDLFSLIVEDPSLARRLHPALPFCRAEALYSASEEMVVGLEDLLRRRIPLLLLLPPERTVLEDGAALASRALGWTGEHRLREIDRLLRPPSLS
ncbi:FAD-dependent oxidoreductase [Candidatus Moduliflexota bacterium]